MDTRISGSYYIRVRKTGWYVWFQSYADGVRKQEPVDKMATRELGFKPEMSVDDAKAHCAQLNRERSFLKEKVRLAAKRVTELRSVDETLFPQDLVKEFQEVLRAENFGSDEHLQKLYSHFNFVQAMVQHLRILPLEYKDSAKRIYRYFIEKKISANYATRILNVLNRWGKFSSKISRSFYEDVPNPRGRELSAIADAQRTKTGTNTELGVRTESSPLTLEELAKAKIKMTEEHYNWLKLSVWFGLRPEEVDSLKDKNAFRVEYNLRKKITILHVYQPKLMSIAEEKRWKKIPVISAEQAECIDLINGSNFERPLDKTVHKYLSEGITCYGGRKNFVDMMMDRGQKLEDVSNWMGHKDISTTWKHYKNKDDVRFVSTEETIGKKNG